MTRLFLERLTNFLSLAHPNFGFPVVKHHPVYGVEQILITYRKIKTLQGFLLVPMTHYPVGYRRVDATAHRVGLPAVPEVMNGRSGIDPHGYHNFTPSPDK